MSMIRVMVVDDHQLLIDGIRSTLEDVKDISVEMTAHNGVEVLKKLEKKNDSIDIILMDIHMPEMDGLDCTQQVCKKYPDIKVIALTQFDERRFIKKMIRYGASGYLLKDSSKRELVEAISKVNKGGKYFTDRISSKLFNQDDKKSENPNKLFPNITSREKEVLEKICKGLSSQEISEALHISYHTVESHRSNLMIKSGVKNTAGLVRWAFENDFIAE